MNTKTRKAEVPDLSNLLGKIVDKRDELPKAPVQEVRPVEPTRESGKNVNTPKPRQEKPAAPKQGKAVASVGGKPTTKDPSVQYVRLSPRIPADLKQELDVAIALGKYVDASGVTLRYIDDFVAEAVRRMLKTKPDK